MATRTVRLTLEELAARPPLDAEGIELMRRLLPPVRPTDAEAQPESSRQAS